MSKHDYTRVFRKTDAPTINDDISSGYEVGDWWLNTTLGKVYECTDDSDGAAVWERMINGSELDDALDSLNAFYAPSSQGVTNGNTHDHFGGDGGQVDHGGLAGIGDDDHTQYIKHSLATAVNDFLVASGAGTFVKQTLAQTVTVLRTVLDGVYALASAVLTMAAGTYTPTLTNVANITSSSVANPFMYIRLGTIVLGAGRIIAQHDGSGDGQIRFTLPVASDLADTDDLQGNATNPAAALACSILPDTTNNEGILFINQGVGTGSIGWRLLFVYIIL